VHVVNDRIEQCIFLSPRQDMPPRAWLAGLFGKPQLSEIDRAGLLSGVPAEKGADNGPTVCSCFGVGRNTICKAIARAGSADRGAGDILPESRRQLRLLRARD
jgi:assimilatory nitrate reductase catalytic subunit